MRDGGPGAVRWARGARAVEDALLAAIEAETVAAEASPGRLLTPVRVVVPSASLRAHVAAAWMRRRRRAAAGVVVETLHTLATDALARSVAPGHPSDRLFPVLVRRFARREPALRQHLEDLVDGYGVVVAAVSDFLDAGFLPEHVDALADATAELAPSRTLATRTQAILRVAAATAEALEEIPFGHGSRLLARARACIERDPTGAVPARALFIHGFAEATGVAADLLEALVRLRSAQVFLDAPPDPADPGASDPFWRFLARLETRLAAAAEADRPPLEPAPEPEPALALWGAPGAHAEVRAVAEAIRDRLDAGAPPETIGIVARDLGAYRSALREQLDAHGIPFSGVGETGSSGSRRRRVRALLDLLQRRGRVPADRWLDAVLDGHIADTDSDPLVAADLRLGLRHLGALRLEDVAGGGVPLRDVPLPLPRAVEDVEDDDSTGPRSVRRTLRRDSLARAVRAAQRTLAAVEELAAANDLGGAVERVRALLGVLGWDPSRPDCREVFDALDSLQSMHPTEFDLREDELLAILRQCWDSVGCPPLGGAGGGVQVLNVMEARARTFDALYVLGMNREVFPRSIPQDPLLLDSIRQALRSVLPDLPVKATGHDEERFLFAQLVASSPEVTLSWQESTDDGRERAASPFVERLRWSGRAIDERSVTPLRARSDVRVAGGAEYALRAGLFGSWQRFVDAFELAVREASETTPDFVDPGAVEAVAAARIAALAELDRPPQNPWRPGPYDGYVGALRDQRDPRHPAPYITTVENVARCPWQAFLGRLLRLEAPPDPLAALPGVDPRLLGMVVHRVLERLVQSQLTDAPRSLEDSRDREPVSIAWPARKRIDAALEEAASYVLEEEGIPLGGLARVLVALARPYVECARRLDWGEPEQRVDVLGVEVEGSVDTAFADRALREIRFRADRVDRVDGELRITDYKTGRPISSAKGEETRLRHHRTAVAAGLRLQAVAYARSAAAEHGAGRLLFLRPDLDPAAAEYVVRQDDADFAEAFGAAMAAIGGAWEQGALGPRLLDGNLAQENRACDRCEVAIACVRGDSGARARLLRWLQSESGTPRSSEERALRDLWRLQSADAMAVPGDSE